MRPLTNLLVLVALLGYSALQYGCSADAQSKDPEESAVTPAVPVEATAVELGDIAAFFSGTASLEAEEEALVVAKAGDVVTELFVEEGDYVEAGQPLAQLDNERLTLELARADVALEQLKRVHDRNKELFEKQLISADEFDRVQSDYETQKAARDLAELQLRHTTVVAPISGFISERQIKVGNMVQTNEPTFRITDFDPLLAVLHVPERELNKLRVGQPAELRVDALPGEQFTGRIERISPVLDPATGTFKVTVEIRDRSRLLKPGMFGRVKIIYDTHTETLLLPKEAVLAEDDETAVYLVRDSMSFRQLVETGYSDERFIEILSGASLGDLVITTGQGNLRDSTRVEVIR